MRSINLVCVCDQATVLASSRLQTRLFPVVSCPPAVHFVSPSLFWYCLRGAADCSFFRPAQPSASRTWCRFFTSSDCSAAILPEEETLCSVSQMKDVFSCSTQKIIITVTEAFNFSRHTARPSRPERLSGTVSAEFLNRLAFSFCFAPPNPKFEDLFAGYARQRCVTY